MSSTAIRDRILELRRVPASELQANERNWRRHPEAQRRALAGMLEDVGFANAALAREDADGNLILIDGHLRADLAADAEVPVLVLDVDEAEANQLLATLDPLAAMAKTDAGKLRALIADTAIGSEDLRSYLEREARSPEARTREDDPPVEARKVTAKRGTMWDLGEHRLLCGDATNDDDYRRLMGRDKAALIFTDPPYGVSYDSDVTGTVAGDDRRRDELVELLAPAFKLMVKHSAAGAAFYIWHADATAEDYRYAMRVAGLDHRQTIVWAKPKIVQGRADYQWAHEPCSYASKAGQGLTFYGDRAQATIWRVGLRQGPAIRAMTLGSGVILTDGHGSEVTIQPGVPRRRVRHERLEPGETLMLEPDNGTGTVWEVAGDVQTSRIHPTQKPVELATRALRNSTLPGAIVLDPFAGSGSTLIGAEVNRRRARAIELDPGLCEAIVERWETFTHRKAKRDAG
jgi:DNA modification methylase